MRDSDRLVVIARQNTSTRLLPPEFVGTFAFSDSELYLPLNWSGTRRRATQRWPGSSADIVSIRRDALVSRRQALEYEGLWIKEPHEFLFDPLTRARRYLQRFPAPPVVSARAE